MNIEPTWHFVTRPHWNQTLLAKYLCCNHQSARSVLTCDEHGKNKKCLQSLSQKSRINHFEDRMWIGRLYKHWFLKNLKMRVGLKWLWSYEHRNVVYGNVCINGCWIVEGISTAQESILIIKANKIHYFSNLFWYRTLHVSDRLTVHHQESSYSIHSNWYLSYSYVDKYQFPWTQY
jgi:hypothetical protein